jgi:hypothetical protein
MAYLILIVVVGLWLEMRYFDGRYLAKPLSAEAGRHAVVVRATVNAAWDNLQRRF